MAQGLPHNDELLASPPNLKGSANNGTELVFMLTGWLFAREGKKSTTFDAVCKALGAQFDFSRSQDFLVYVMNTDTRKKEIGDLIQAVTG